MPLKPLKPITGKKNVPPPVATTKAKIGAKMGAAPKRASSSNGEDTDSPLNRKVSFGSYKKKAVDPIEVEATIGAITTKQVKADANGNERTMISIPLSFEQNGKTRNMTANIFANSAWLEDGFDPEKLDDDEAKIYNMFHSRIIGSERSGRGLLSAFYDLNETNDSWSAVFQGLNGQSVRALLGPGYNDESQYELKAFLHTREQQ